MKPAQNFGGAYDLSVLRIPGILQRIAWAYIVVTLWEICLPVRDDGFEDVSYFRFYSRYAWHWLACFVVVFTYVIAVCVLHACVPLNTLLF
jgi:hypothetical protein